MPAGDAGEPFVAQTKRADYFDRRVQATSQYNKDGKALDQGNGLGGGFSSPVSGEEIIGQGNVSTLQAFQGSRILAMPGTNVNVMGDEIVSSAQNDGKTRWRYKLPGDMHASGGQLAAAPISAGGSVIVATLQGEVLRFDAASGKLVAKWNVGAPIRSQPIAEDGFLYVGTDDGKLVAIDTGDRSLTGWRTWGANAQRTGAIAR